MEQYPRESREYLPVAVEGDADLDTLPVEMQVLAYGTRPTSAGWKTATWGVDGNGNAAARVLIGPETDWDFSAAPGTVVPWVRITSTPEIPVLEGDPVQIT